MPANVLVQAAAFLLKAGRPEKYTERQKHDHDVKVSQYSPEARELAKRLAVLSFPAFRTRASH